METNQACNKGGIVPMGSIPIATVKDADGVIHDTRKTLEESDETILVVNLELRAG